MPTQLQNFDVATPDEIRKLICNSPTKSCALDPILTFLLKECVDELPSITTAIINSSIKSAKVLYNLKGIVTPLLKKATLHQNIRSNYRPVFNLSFVFKLPEK